MWTYLSRAYIIIITAGYTRRSNLLLQAPLPWWQADKSGSPSGHLQIPSTLYHTQCPQVVFWNININSSNSYVLAI